MIKIITITTTFLFFSIPAWSMDSKQMKEILKNIIKENSYQQTQKLANHRKNITLLQEKNKKLTESGPEVNLFSSPSPEEALLKSGIQLFEASFYDNAKINFEKFRNDFPNSSYSDLAAVWLSKIYLKEKNTDKAANILKTISSDSGEFPAALSLLGEIYIRKGDDAKAIEYFYRIASLFPNHELADDSLIEIATLYIKTNKGNQAIEAAIKVINNYKERETLDDAYYLVARVFEKDIILKDFSIARKIYKIFLKKALTDKDPAFFNSPLIKKVETNLHNIEKNYYGKIINS